MTNRTLPGIILCWALLAACCAPWARAQDSSENVIAELMRRVSRLESENVDLKARVEMLEVRLRSAPGSGGAPAGGPLAAAPAQPMPVMKFFAMATPQPDPSLPAKAQQLRDDATQLDQQVAQIRIQIGQLMDQSVVSDVDGSREATAGQRQALRQQLDGLEDQIMRKRAAASKCDHDFAHPTQLLKGWDGRRIVVLPIEQNFAGLASSLNPGDFVGWRGTRVQLTDTVDQYDKVFVLQRAVAPAGYQDPPGGALPE